MNYLSLCTQEPDIELELCGIIIINLSTSITIHFIPECYSVTAHFRGDPIHNVCTHLILLVPIETSSEKHFKLQTS